MERCDMNLREALDAINKELNQNYNNGMTLIGAYLATEIFFEILKGINYLHSQKPAPVLHRDLKLSNILITNGENGHFIKICDFGLATINKIENTDAADIESFDINLKHTQNLGTPIYMAPEVLLGKYDTSADMFSLGVILCKLFSIEFKNSNDFLKYFDESTLKSHEYYPIKQIKLIHQLLQQWPSKRPKCEDVLRERNEWSVNFDRDIKISDKFAEYLYNEFEMQFKKGNEEKLSTKILIKKCHTQVEKNFKRMYSQRNITNRIINEYHNMKNALSVNIVEIISNINDDIKNNILKILLHYLHIFYDSSELCYNVENTLNNNYKSIWHCFASFEHQHHFDNLTINWSNYPYYIISFYNNFLEKQMHLLIINTPNIKKTCESALASDSISDEMFESLAKLSLNAINKYDSVNKLEEYIGKELKKKYGNQELYCYIGKNELFSCHGSIFEPKIYFAIRLKEFNILISSEKVDITSIDAIKFEQKILNKIGCDDRNAIIDAFSQPFVYRGIILKQFESNNQKKCIIRISNDCRFATQNFTNYKIGIYDIQILWLNENQLENEIECNDSTIDRLRRSCTTHSDVNSEFEKIKDSFLNINSSSELLIDSLKSCIKLLSYGELNEEKDKFRSLGLLNFSKRILQNCENKELLIILLQTVNYYMKLLMFTDHDSITESLIPDYVKLLESNDDNICFYTVEAFIIMCGHCEECRQKTLISGFMTANLLLIQPIKSLNLLRSVSRTFSTIVSSKSTPLPIDILQQILKGLDTLIHHTDEFIILRVLRTLRCIIECDNQYIELIRGNGLFPKILQIVLSDNKELQYESLRTLGTIFMNTLLENSFNGDLFNINIYLVFVEFLTCEYTEIRLSAVQVLSQIFFENSTQIQPLIDTNLIEPLINLMIDEPNVIKTPTLKFLHGIVLKSNEQQLSYIYSKGVINILSDILTSYLEKNESEYCFVVLFVMKMLIDKCQTHRNQIIHDILRCNVLEKIQPLENHNDDPIRQIVKFFFRLALRHITSQQGSSH